jgi:hypothetical protein
MNQIITEWRIHVLEEHQVRENNILTSSKDANLREDPDWQDDHTRS